MISAGQISHFFLAFGLLPCCLMDDIPPPLPPKESEGREDNTFSRHASKASIIAPSLVLAVIYGFGALKNQEIGSERLIALVEGAVAFLLMVAGVVLGVLALAFMRGPDRRPIIFRAASGIAMSSLFLAIFIPNFLSARQKALAQRHALEQVHAASRDLQKEAVQSAKDGRPVDATRLTKAIDNAASTASGEMAAVLRGTSAFAQRVQTLQADYSSAANDLSDGHVLRLSDLTEREQTQARKAIVQRFLDANDALKDFLKAHEENFRKELLNQNISSVTVSSTLNGYRKPAAMQTPLLIEVRKTDHRLGAAMFGILDILDTNWGQWQYNTNNGKVTFNSQNVLQQYNSYLQEMELARQDQRVAQQALANIIRQRAEANTPARN